MEPNSRRWTTVSDSAFDHEREALACLRRELNDQDPNRSWWNGDGGTRQWVADQALRVTLSPAGPPAGTCSPSRRSSTAPWSKLTDQLFVTGGTAVWLLVGSPGTAERPTIDKRAVPVLSGNEWARIPDSWLKNTHRAVAVKGPTP